MIVGMLVRTNEELSEASRRDVSFSTPSTQGFVIECMRSHLGKRCFKVFDGNSLLVDESLV
jgi:hypothetical protein